MPRTATSHVNYLLRHPTSKEDTPITCIVRFNGERMNVGTGYKVSPLHWSVKKQRIKNVLDVSERGNINYFLDNLEDVINKFIFDLKTNCQPITKETVRNRINEHLRPSANTELPRTLLDFVQYFIDTCPTRLAKGSKARSGRFLSADTIRRYKTTQRGLEDFAKIYPRPLYFNNIDKEFYNSFVSWLISKNYATNNVSKYVENLKGFMTVAVEEQFTTNVAYLKFANLREDSENIYLTINELEKIYNLSLEAHPKLIHTRDLFIFAAYTGLRFSDFASIQKASIKVNEQGKKFLDIKQRKTGGRVYIPLVSRVITEILDKYKDQLPMSLSNQKTNDYLKELCKLAEINSIEQKHITKGGKEVMKTPDGWAANSEGVEKWQLVTTHTARRSFATNMFKNGMPTQLIMRLTGHKKESEFLKYIKADQTDIMNMTIKQLEALDFNDVNIN